MIALSVPMSLSRSCCLCLSLCFCLTAFVYLSVFVSLSFFLEMDPTFSLVDKDLTQNIPSATSKARGLLALEQISPFFQPAECGSIFGHQKDQKSVPSIYFYMSHASLLSGQYSSVCDRKHFVQSRIMLCK